MHASHQETESTPLHLALSYAARGWFVLPVYETLPDGRCSCKDRDHCQNVGKHPRLKHGYKPSNDREVISEW